MKKIVDRWCSIGLLKRIFCGLVLGVIFGLFVPTFSFVSILGTIFVGALKAIAPVLVGVLVISSVSTAGQGIGKRFKTVIFLYMITTFIAASVAVIASYAFPVSIQLFETYVADSPKGLKEVLTNLLLNMIANPISSITEANYMGILFWAIILG